MNVFRISKASVSACLLSVVLIPFAAGQLAPIQRVTGSEPLEKYDNPPAPFEAITVTSPAIVSQFGPYTSYQVNVDGTGSNVVGDAANEPSICVDPTDGNKMSYLAPYLQGGLVNFVWVAFWFLVVLTVLVFIHELGHYLIARRNGVKIEVFSIGFGPELYGWWDRSVQAGAVRA